MEHADIVLSLYDEANGKPEKEGRVAACRLQGLHQIQPNPDQF